MVVAASLVLATATGCRGHASGGAQTTDALVPGQVLPAGGNGVPMRTRVHRGEGQLELLTWRRPVARQIVQPFEDQTGCEVHVTAGVSPKEVATALATGRVDGVLAAGDTSNRLISARRVAPLDIGLIPDAGQVPAKLAHAPSIMVNGVSYGVAATWSANVLAYNARAVQLPPTSWDVVFDGHSYAGNVTAFDSPMDIADAALFLKGRDSSLGITDPYELSRRQFEAAVEVMAGQRAQVVDYWASAPAGVDMFADGRAVVGQAWPSQVATLQRDHQPILAVVPREGMTGWSDAWMMSATAAHPNCMLRWLRYVATPAVQALAAASAGDAPANPQACTLLDRLQPDYCAERHVTDPGYLDALSPWRTPEPDCGTGKQRCVGYAEWARAWMGLGG